MIYLTVKEVCARYRVSRRTLLRWRKNHTGPLYTWFGGRVKYAVEDFEEWLENRKVRR